MKRKLSRSDQAKLRKFKVYTDAEFQLLLGSAQGRQERLLAAVVDNREAQLSDRDFRYLQLLKRAYNILTDSFSPLIARRKIERLLDISSRTRTNQVIADVKVIFCQVEERNLDWERMVFELKLSKYIDRLQRENIHSRALPDLYKLMAKIKGVDKPAEQSFNWEEWQPPVPVYSSDPNTLSLTEDIDHEEV